MFLCTGCAVSLRLMGFTSTRWSTLVTGCFWQSHKIRPGCNRSRHCPFIGAQSAAEPTL